MLYTQSPAKWERYKYLHREVYRMIKADPSVQANFPNLVVFSSIQYGSLLIQVNGSADPLGKAQQILDSNYMASNDVAGWSNYPYLLETKSNPDVAFPPAHFELMLKFSQSANKVMAISETAFPSRPIAHVQFTPQHQASYYDTLLNITQNNRFKFVVNWQALDTDAFYRRYPDYGAIAPLFQYNGLADGDSNPKPAQNIWDSWQ